MGLQAGVLKVEILATPPEWNVESRVVLESSELVSQLASLFFALRQHGVRELRLLLHELLGLLCLRVLQPVNTERVNNTINI